MGREDGRADEQHRSGGRQTSPHGNGYQNRLRERSLFVSNWSRLFFIDVIKRCLLTVSGSKRIYVHYHRRTHVVRAKFCLSLSRGASGVVSSVSCIVNEKTEIVMLEAPPRADHRIKTYGFLRRKNGIGQGCPCIVFMYHRPEERRSVLFGVRRGDIWRMSHSPP